MHDNCLNKIKEQWLLRLKELSWYLLINLLKAEIIMVLINLLAMTKQENLDLSYNE